MPVGSVTQAALQSALDGLALRQRSIADNIANVNTPGYTAKRVQFEDALATSVRQGDGMVAATTSRSLEPTRLDGNNVNLDTETLTDEKTALQYQLLSGAMSSKFALLDTVLRG